MTDLAVANFQSDNVSVLLGAGDGTFVTLQQSFDVGDGPFSVATGDFNGDGVVDLVTANPSSDDLSVLLGVGDGTFADQQTLVPESRPVDVTSGDFNGDGITDLATATLGGGYSGSTLVFLGSGDGAFGTPQAFNSALSTRSIITSDFNRDGITDLATSHGAFGFFCDSELTVLLGQCDGGFLLGDVNLDGNVSLLDIGPFVERVVSGEFQAEADTNQDGVVDLLDIAPFVDILTGG